MIKHIVMWKLKDEAAGLTREAIAHRIKADLEALKNVIPRIAAIEVGINEKPSPAACDVSLYSEFATWDDLAAYQEHPEHQKIVGFVREVVTARHVVDYER